MGGDEIMIVNNKKLKKQLLGVPNPKRLEGPLSFLEVRKAQKKN